MLLARTGRPEFTQLLAVKMIRPELQDRDEVRRLFLDEARLIARIEHPTVVRVHDFGDDDGVLFLAMEYVQGVSVESWLAERGPLPPRVAAEIVAQACRGLHAAHTLADAEGHPLQVVHRDVSPSNLMVTFQGHVKILDFGIALMRDRTAPTTAIGRLRGKIAYMAPEQIGGEPVDGRTDVWGLANVLFELLTGRRLRGDLELAEVVALLDRSPRTPSSIVPGVPEALDRIALRGLSRDPSARYPDAHAMALDLEGAVRTLEGETLEELVIHELAEARAQQRRRLAELLRRAPRRPAHRPPHRVRQSWIALSAMIGAALGLLLAITLADPSVPEVPRPPPPLAPRPAEPLRRSSAVVVAPRFGYLTVGAHPFALVQIDGKDMGPTPLFEARLPAGVHRVTLIDPATLAVRLARTITIRSEGHERLTLPAP